MNRYVVYRESGSLCDGTLQFHRTCGRTLQEAKLECQRQADLHGGWVTVQRNGMEVYARCKGVQS